MLAMPARNKLSVKAVAILMVCILAAGVGYTVWRLRQPVVSPQTQAKQATELDISRRLSKQGKCKQAIESLNKLLRERGLQPSVEAEAHLLIAQCQLSAKDYKATISELETAKGMYQKLNDRFHLNQIDLLLEQAKVMQSSQTSPPATPPAVKPNPSQGTYDGVSAL